MNKKTINNYKGDDKKFQIGNVSLISFSHLVHDTYGAFLSPVLPLLIKNLNISYSLVSFLLVIRSLPSLFNPFIGLLADKISLRFFIVLAPTITAIAMSMLGFASSYFVLVVLLFVSGISSSLYHVPAPVMVKKLSGNRAGLGMSLYMLGGELARTVGPLVILGAVSLWGFKGAYRLIPFAVLASIVLFVKLRKIPINKEFQKNTNHLGWLATLKKHSSLFLIIGGYLFFVSLLKSAMAFYLPTYLNIQGSSLWLGGISLAVFQFAGAAGTLLSGVISDKFGSRKTLIFASVIAPFVMLGFTFAQGTILPFILLVFLGLLLFASSPVILVIVTSLDVDRPAFINGTYMSISFLISSVAVMLVGVLSDGFGLLITYRILAVAGLGAIPFVFFLCSRKR